MAAPTFSDAILSVITALRDRLEKRDNDLAAEIRTLADELSVVRARIATVESFVLDALAARERESTR